MDKVSVTLLITTIQTYNSGSLKMPLKLHHKSRFHSSSPPMSSVVNPVCVLLMFLEGWKEVRHLALTIWSENGGAL